MSRPSSMKCWCTRTTSRALRGRSRDALREHRSFNLLVRARRADGQWRWVHDYGAPRFSPEGEFLGLIGTFPDVTEETETERALRDEDRRKDDFLAMLAHELRNPLTPIRNAVAILRPQGPARTRRWRGAAR